MHLYPSRKCGYPTRCTAATIGPYEEPCDYKVIDVALFVTIDTESTGRDSWTVDVRVEVGYCCPEPCPPETPCCPEPGSQ